MSIFGNIVSKIFHHAATPDQIADAGTPAAGASAAEAPASAATSSAPAPAGSGATTPPADGGPTASASASGQSVDVAAVLEGLAAKNSQKLDWRHSIVDMMKLLDLDSSLSSRKELAQELHYTGNMDDSASMNTWLHGQVMKKLAENGGKVPDDLKV